MSGRGLVLAPENDALLIGALGYPAANALRKGSRTVSTPVQISAQELERLLNAARLSGGSVFDYGDNEYD